MIDCRIELVVSVAETVRLSEAYVSIFVIPAKGSVAKVQKGRFEIAARFFESLAMT